ncbi:LysM peptidoglycan-binding domain-containing protein [Flavobacterium magnesitis]|uniref:C40 family peptidase n=1 Tax=Flavobacterium magnesitis TaxID=3138077 RepID=UPI00358F4AF9
MRCKFWILILVLFSKWNGFSQEKYIQHVVAKGETVSKIAQQYNVKPVAIYEINPDAKRGIKFKEILLVPFTSNGKKEVANTSNSEIKEKKHIVLAKETLYGIAKQYGVKVADLYRLNANLENRGLQVGKIIQIPVVESKDEIVENSTKKENLKTEIKEEPKTKVSPVIVEENREVTTVNANGNYIKEVLAKETLYGIAKSYGVLVADLEKANPILESQPLRIGQKIVIPNAKGQQLIQEKPILVPKEELKTTLSDNKITTVAPVSEKAIISEKEKDTEVEVIREVLAKETKYGIAKEFGLTVKELETQNPKIVNRLLVGEKLTIRTLKSNVKTTPKVDFSSESLNNKIDTDYKDNSFKVDFVDQLISTASENIGTRYRTGGTSKDGFDCSGLMCTTFGAFDIQLPRTSFEQSQFGMKIDAEQAQKGDLIFFKTNGRSRINHVGMVVEVAPDGEIKFIHASVSNGVIISSVKEKYYSRRVTQINRVL